MNRVGVVATVGEIRYTPRRSRDANLVNHPARGGKRCAGNTENRRCAFQRFNRCIEGYLAYTFRTKDVHRSSRFQKRSVNSRSYSLCALPFIILTVSARFSGTGCLA